jgi:hypothetical protein
MDVWPRPLCGGGHSAARLSHRSLAESNLECRRSAAADQLQIDSSTDAIHAQQMHDIAHAIDRFCIPSHDDVTHEQPGARGRPIRIDTHDENAAHTARRLRVVGGTSAPQWLQAGTKISPKNMTLREELIDDAIDCRRGNGKHAATRPQDGHADDASLRVDEGATLSGPAEHKIYADEVIDSAAAKTVPGPPHGGDDAEASDRRTFVISDCQDDVTWSQWRRIGGRRCRQSIRLEAQHSDVRTGVPTRERGLD